MQDSSWYSSKNCHLNYVTSKNIFNMHVRSKRYTWHPHCPRAARASSSAEATAPAPRHRRRPATASRTACESGARRRASHYSGFGAVQEAARRRAASAAARSARGVIRDPRRHRSARGVTRDRRRARPASPEYPPSRRRVAVASCHQSWSPSWHVDSERGRVPDYPPYRSGLPPGYHPLLW